MPFSTGPADPVPHPAHWTPPPFEPVDERVDTTAHSGDAAGAAHLLATTRTEDLSDDECLGVIDDIERARRSLDAAAAGVFAEIDKRSLCDTRYGTTTAIWYERRHGRSRAAVSRETRTAKRLTGDLPALLDAARDARISWERVAFIASKVNCRNREAIRAAQEALIALSDAEPSWAAFCALVSDLARYADPDGGHDPSEPTSRLAMRRTGDQLLLDAVLTGSDGHSFEQLLEAHTDRLWRQWRSDSETCPEITVPSRAQIRAQALVELVRRGSNAGPTTSRPAPPELNLIIDADRVDELDPLLDQALGRSSGSHQPSAGLPPHASPDARPCPSCRAGHSDVGTFGSLPITTPNGTRAWFSASEWELLTCNAHISETLLDQMGTPIAVRDRQRFPNRAMRRSLVARDSGCVFPGCEAPPGWCDAHHVIEYSANGRTVITNLALLCRHHHGVVHRTGWTMRAVPPRSTGDTDTTGHTGAERFNSHFTITSPHGLKLHTRHRPRPPSPD